MHVYYLYICVYLHHTFWVWTGRVIREVVIGSREEAAKCMQKVLRRRVMVSSARQAIAGLLTVGPINGARYLAKKMQKAWKSRT